MPSAARRFALSTLCLVSGLGTGLRAGSTFKVLTLNTYSFPEGKTAIVKGVGIADLQSGIDQSVPKRAELIARLAKSDQLDPDVVMFQELWGDTNKNRMIGLLRDKFRYVFWNDEIKNSLPKEALYLDDGLLVCSKLLPFFEKKIVYDARTGDEDAGITRGGAHKGALILCFWGDKGSNLILVDTHLQSGTGHDEVATRENQIKQLARTLKEMQAADPRLRNAQLFIGGDLNEPIGLRAEESRLVDRSSYLAQVLTSGGIPVSESQMLHYLVTKYKVREVAQVDELRQQVTVLSAEGKPKYTANLDKSIKPPDPASYEQFKSGDYYKVSQSFEAGAPAKGNLAPANDYAISGRLNGRDHRFSYFQDATDPSGIQFLDHIFINNDRTRLKDVRVLRQDCLGDTGGGKHYDGRYAMSDHAAVLFTFEAK